MTLFQLAWCCGLCSQLETACFLCGVCKSCLLKALCCSFLQSKHMHVRLTDDSKLTIGVNNCVPGLCDSEDRLQSAFKMDRSNCIKLSLQSNYVYYGNSIKE